MALNDSTLQSDIETELTGLGFDLETGQAGVLAEAVAKAVVKHIQANAEVATTVTGTTSDGASVTGSGAGGVS